MDRGKPDVGDFIDFAQLFHHVISNRRRADLFLVSTPLFFQFTQHLVDLILRDCTFGARKPNTPFELGATVGLTSAIAFDHNQGRELLAFE